MNVEELAVETLERLRWPNGAACPWCSERQVKQIGSREGGRNHRNLWRCVGCGSQFTWRIGTVLEQSRLSDSKLLQALLIFSEGPISALELTRRLCVAYKSALFLCHRLRWGVSGSASRTVAAPAGPRDKTKGGPVHHSISDARETLYRAEEAWRASGSPLEIRGRFLMKNPTTKERGKEWKELMGCRSLLKRTLRLSREASLSQSEASTRRQTSGT